MTYQMWEHVADSVVPLLGLIALLAPWFGPSQFAQPRTDYYLRIAIAWLATIALRALNHSDWALWPLMGAQYSGHTGVFMVFAVSLAAWNLRWVWLGVVVLLLYGQLMIHQGYHAFGDILATALAMGPITWGLQRVFPKQKSDAVGVSLPDSSPQSAQALETLKSERD